MIEAQRSSDWTFARAREPLLAQWQPGELLYPEAAELRARWRVELGERGDLAAAIAIVDAQLQRVSLPRILLYRAEIAARDGRKDLAWLSLDALAEKGMAAMPAVLQRGLALARELGPPPSPDLPARLVRLANRRNAAAPGAAPLAD